MFRLGALCPGTMVDVVQSPQSHGLSRSQTTRKRFLTIQKSVTNLDLVRQQLQCEKVNIAGTDENLFRLVPVPGHGARGLPLELVPVPRYGARALPLELVPVPRYGARALPLELVPVPRYGARVPPLELVPVPGYGARVLPLELVPVPWHGARVLPLELQ